MANNRDHKLVNSQRLNHLFQPIVDQAPIEKLLQHIAYGQQADAELMLDVMPNLLLMSGTVEDHSHRTIVNVTPVQLAFGGEDEVMTAMLKERLCQYYEKMHGKCELGEAEFLRQLDEKFPEDASLNKNAIAEFDEMMKRIMLAIGDSRANIQDELRHVPNESPLRQLLDEFRARYAPGVIKSGKHFFVELINRANALYYSNVNRLHDHVHNYEEEWHRLILFGRQICGYLQRSLPISYAQAACQGSKELIAGAPLQRSLKYWLGDLSYYPLDVDPANRLGFDHGVFVSLYRAEISSLGGEMHDFDKLVAYKQDKLAELRKPSRLEKSWCAML